MNNFGDRLSPLILKKILPNYEIKYSEPGRRLLGLGSILYEANDNDIIWGTGVNGKIPRIKDNVKNLDILALRGPLTHSFLNSVKIDVDDDIPYGDPGLLMSELFPEFRSTVKVGGAFYLPHYDDENAFPGGPRRINVSDDIPEIIGKITSADVLITSSLHGIVVADSYGIPCVYKKGAEPTFKYEDYFYSTNRGRESVHRVSMPYPPLIIKMKKELLNSITERF